MMNATVKVRNKESVREVNYALDAIEASMISEKELSRRLSRSTVILIVSFLVSIGCFLVIRFGPRLGEAAPYVALIWLGVSALFVYSVIAFAVLVISAVSLQHVRLIETKSEVVDFMDELGWAKDVLADLYTLDRKSVEDAAARHGKQGRENLVGMGIAK